MKLGEIKKLIADLDDDLEAVAAPMALIPFIGKIGGRIEDMDSFEEMASVPDPTIRFKIVYLSVGGARMAPGHYKDFVVFGFDADESSGELDDDEGKLIG
jgi:hypothetical protein